MALRSFSCTNFRCLASVSLAADPHYNLVFGPNASGKTSLLEAIAYLGRGKSFRGAPTERLIRHGASEFVLFGKVQSAGRDIPVGVRNGREGLEISVDSDRSGGAAALASVLPLQVVDPDVHNLVAGGPEHRRRFLDWLAFHVEPNYLDSWRHFRRALRQRNAVLRDGRSAGLRAWDPQFVEQALEVDRARRSALAAAITELESIGRRLLGSPVAFEYRPGWAAASELEAVLHSNQGRDLQTGSTGDGPHRADLRLAYDERQAQKLVSRGQQKLLACAMILAATRLVQLRLDQPLLLLLDDPAAELDAASLERLMGEVAGLGSQVVATALHREAQLFPREPTRFHVEQGVLTPAA